MDLFPRLREKKKELLKKVEKILKSLNA
jgi:hypothetical protein